MDQMPKDLIYQQPPEMSRKQLEAEFATDDPERILHALIAAFYTEPPQWVEGRRVVLQVCHAFR